MIYEWDATLETGNEAIDKQHKELFAVLNALIAAYERGGKAGELNRAVEFLTVYVLKHFSDEEKLQEEYGYPDIKNHKIYHNEFKKTVANLVQQLEEQGYCDSIVKTTIQTVANWLKHHIKSDDFRLAVHIQTLHSKKHQ